MSSHPRSWLDSLIGASLSLLLAALALFEAVRLVERVWLGLLLIIDTTLGLTAAVLAVRSRSRNW